MSLLLPQKLQTEFLHFLEHKLTDMESRLGALDQVSSRALSLICSLYHFYMFCRRKVRCRLRCHRSRRSSRRLIMWVKYDDTKLLRMTTVRQFSM